jgi:hypothetical protein
MSLNKCLSHEALATKRKALLSGGICAENNIANNPIPKSKRRAQTSATPQKNP